MGLLPCLLIPLALATLEPTSIPAPVVELRSDLGRDPMTRIQLAPAGCWDGLIKGVVARPVPPDRKRTAGTTVEVWDFFPATSPRQEAFGLYLDTLRERLSRAWLSPPPVHGAIELNEIMSNDPGSPQKLDLTKVKSMQERYNRLPPNGSPVQPH